MKVMFLDESGDHKLKNINPNYPMFVLGGVIAERAYVRGVIEPEVAKFKHRHFGRTDVILHTVDMRNNAGDFAFLTDAVRRGAFYAELNFLLQGLDYRVLACAIRKDAHVARYGRNATDPYLYAMDVLIERFCWALGNQLDAGFIYAEKRNPTLDQEVMEVWETLRTSGVGTGFVSSQRIEECIVGLDLRDKKPNLAGMQLADLVVTPVGRHALGTPEKPEQVQWSVVRSKLLQIGHPIQGVRAEDFAMTWAKKRGLGLLHSTSASRGTATQYPLLRTIVRKSAGLSTTSST